MTLLHAVKACHDPSKGLGPSMRAGVSLLGWGPKQLFSPMHFPLLYHPPNPATPSPKASQHPQHIYPACHVVFATTQPLLRAWPASPFAFALKPPSQFTVRPPMIRAEATPYAVWMGPRLRVHMHMTLVHPLAAANCNRHWGLRAGGAFWWHCWGGGKTSFFWIDSLHCCTTPLWGHTHNHNGPLHPQHMPHD